MATPNVVLKLVCVRFMRLCQSIAALFRRALCFARKKDNIGELPFTVKRDEQSLVPSSVASPTSAPPTANWDDNWDQKEIVEDKIEQWRKQQTVVAAQDTMKEPSFFDDMAPDIRKAKKVVLKPRVPASQQAQPVARNLFEFTADVPEISAELGDLDDDQPAWDDDVSSTLNQHRSALAEERRQKHIERMLKIKGDTHYVYST